MCMCVRVCECVCACVCAACWRVWAVIELQAVPLRNEEEGTAPGPGPRRDGPVGWGRRGARFALSLNPHRRLQTSSVRTEKAGSRPLSRHLAGQSQLVSPCQERAPSWGAPHAPSARPSAAGPQPPVPEAAARGRRSTAHRPGSWLQVAPAVCGWKGLSSLRVLRGQSRAETCWDRGPMTCIDPPGAF